MMYIDYCLYLFYFFSNYLYGIKNENMLISDNDKVCSMFNLSRQIKFVFMRSNDNFNLEIYIIVIYNYHTFIFIANK